MYIHSLEHSDPYGWCTNTYQYCTHTVISYSNACTMYIPHQTTSAAYQYWRLHIYFFKARLGVLFLENVLLLGPAIIRDNTVDLLAKTKGKIAIMQCYSHVMVSMAMAIPSSMLLGILHTPSCSSFQGLTFTCQGLTISETEVRGPRYSCLP